MTSSVHLQGFSHSYKGVMKNQAQQNGKIIIKNYKNAWGGLSPQET